MTTGTLLLTIETAYSGLHVLRTRTPGTPSGDQDDPHESNTFGLPNGSPIRRQFKRFARRQLRKILGALPAIGAPLPAAFPPLADWTNPMASAMTPIIGAYWDEAGKTTRARLGLDPDAWEVHDPHLHAKIQGASLKFCAETNATTDLEPGHALETLRAELVAGLVEHGEAIPELARRVKGVFGRITEWRAEMIARTEASRAVHSAAIESARQSGVVRGKKWLVSANSCDKCVAKAERFNAGSGIALDASFGDPIGHSADYADVPGPPLHPHCRCTLVFVLTEEYESILAAIGPEFDTFEPGSLGPEPKERRVRKRVA